MTEVQTQTESLLCDRSILYFDSYVSSIQPPTIVMQKAGSGTLCLGGVDVIKNGSFRKYKLPECAHIVSIISGNIFFHYLTAAHSDLKRELYEIEDNLDERIDHLFDNVTESIYSSLEEGNNVYVHCFMGISRSAAFTVAYLMRYHDMTLDSAKDFLREKRRISININFICQLRSYEEKLKKKKTV